MLEPVIQRSAVLVHPQPHDVDMVAVDVGMLVHQIRLVAIAQLPHILPCDVGKLLVGQHVFRVRVYGNMKYRLLGGKLDGHLHFKAAHTLADREIPVLAQQHFVGKKHLCFLAVHLVLVVRQCAEHIAASAYFGNHSSLHSFVRSIT